MFYSILFTTKEQHTQPRLTEAPDCWSDLNIDQILAPILKEKAEYELEVFFYSTLIDPEIITYRQEIMDELEDSSLRKLLSDFSKTVYDLSRYMSNVIKSLSSDDSYDNNYLTRGRMLDYADKYCQSVSALSSGLTTISLRAVGLRGFSDYLEDYCKSGFFTSLCGRVAKLRDEFSTIQYCMLIKDGTIRVRKYEGQANHSEQILACFEKFRQGEVKDYRHKLYEEPSATHVEVAVLRMLAGLYKEIFSDLNSFCAEYIGFCDETISRFSREIQFFLSWLDFIGPLEQEGLPFCYPKICDSTEHLYNLDGFDLALARIEQGKTVVNDFVLKEPEHIIVVTGPNQGGKTTYARAFGQMHYLASLGLSVPGREATLYLFDSILTHFGSEEDLSTLNGKLQDDLVRLHSLLNNATSRSIIIINEIFTSTTLSDALALGKHMMDSLISLGAPTVLVTFLDELAEYSRQTVSMMSTVKEDDTTQRTFKIIRKPPDGLAYAIHIAGKHGLTYEQLRGRLIRCKLDVQ